MARRPSSTPPPPRPQQPLSASAAALAEILLNKELAKKLETRFHRTMLWRWSTGRGLPDLERATLLDEQTEGQVAAKGWIVEGLGNLVTVCKGKRTGRATRRRKKEAA